MYLITVFLFFFGLPAIWASGSLIYQHTYFSKLERDAQLPVWEHALYYLIAVYPFIGYVILMKSYQFLQQVQLPADTIHTYKLLFTTGHIILSILSVTVIRYLIKRSKLHVLFAATTLWAGSIFFTGAFALLITAN